MKVLRILLFVLVAGQIGCSTAPKQMYDGEPRPLNEIAMIHEGKRGSFQVLEVDGRSTGIGWPAGLYVLPGMHRITVLYTSPGYGYVTTWKKELDLKAEAGHTYFPRFELVGDKKMRFWFDDKGVGYPTKCLDQDVYVTKYFQGKAVPDCK